jgi:hypothetical protein
MRRETLKMYIFSLLADGQFEGMSSPSAIASKAVKIFAQDLPVVMGEIAQMAAEQSGNRIGAAVLGKMNELIGEVGRRGLKAVWADLQDQYKRGMEANAETAASRKR